MIINLIRYIILSTALISLFYVLFRLIYNNDNNFRSLRFYLMFSVFLSLLLPLIPYSIELPVKDSIPVTGALTTHVVTAEAMSEVAQSASFNWFGLVLTIYASIASLLILRIFAQLIMLAFYYIRSEKIIYDNYTVLLNHKFKSHFSFFKWIFVSPDSVSVEELDQIIAHEKIHASQYHSADLIVIELLSAVMWFNPLIWMMKNSIQLVHEYLADEGALSTGIDRIRYQELLISQVTEERLVHLSSSFNYSLIKKRMKMITQSKTKKRKGLKILTLIPVTAIIFIMLAFINGIYPVKAKAGSAVDSREPLIISEGNKDPLIQPLSSPDDTIKKKKVVKIIKEDGSADTVIAKQIRITIVNGDTTENVEIIGADDDDVFVTGYAYADDYVYEMQKRRLSDSATQLKVIVETDDSEDNAKQEHIIVRGYGSASFANKDGNYTWVSRTIGEEDNLLYIIDGVEQKGTNPVKNLDSDDIESMEVIKGGEKMEKYAGQGYDGIINITTKKGKE